MNNTIFYYVYLIKIFIYFITLIHINIIFKKNVQIGVGPLHLWVKGVSLVFVCK